MTVPTPSANQRPTGPMPGRVSLDPFADLVESDADPGPLWIKSTARRDPDEQPMFELSWGTWSAYAGLDAVLQTAHDLYTAASLADLIQLMLDTGRDSRYIGRHGSDLYTASLKGSGRTALGRRETVMVKPAGSSKRGEAVVLVARSRTLHGELSPEEARAMGHDWLCAAEGAENDRVLSQVLYGTIGLDDAQIQRTLAGIRAVRASVRPSQQRG